MGLQRLTISCIKKGKKILTTILRPIFGIFFALSILMTSYFGNYIMCIILPLIFFMGHKKFRNLADQAIAFWLFVPMSLLQYLLGVTVRLNGDIIDVTKPSIIIMNHRTRLDWLYIWNALYRMNPWLIVNLKIALKNELQYFPGVGFGMLTSNFLFFKRKMVEDGPMIDECIDYFKYLNKPFQIFMFPEGTDKSEYTTMISNKYALKNNLEPLNYCLYPRTAGFVHLIKTMRKHNYISAVYNITIGYPNNIVQSELALGLKGDVPKNVHFDVEKIDINSIPVDDEDVSEWLTELWQKKDMKLKKYYQQTLASRRKFDNNNIEGLWIKDSWKQFSVKMISFSVWCLLCPLFYYHLSFLWIVQILFIYMLIVKFFIWLIFGRVDYFIRWFWKRETNYKNQNVEIN
ncbi:Lysocardiolipin acyltransferase 1 [Strongyloides ratti]|uniref:Lysocardiolipin acyltransferase 1 n=1 Tax=Strongyloides ratti TaxID=34506 RepID=A0A090MSL1_STRRB|nr:Lysocardiolipin acyltransferase 1 [Strongyloides ratti]CEF61248.1 Lysocardiolipin acyltransferase 1 [Strongyloides ratti]